MNHQVAAALKVFAIETKRPEVLTTALYVENLTRWFKLVTARELQLALSKKNQDAYESALNFLNSFKYFIHRCRVGEKKRWKPWQAAIIMASDALLRLQDFFLCNGYDFLFLSRFTQDCVENIFYQLRLKCRTPRALHVKNNLKLLTIGQVMDEVLNSSYSYDENEWLVSFSEKLESTKSIPVESIKTQSSEDFEDNETKEQIDVMFQESEEQTIYYIAGVILHRLHNRGTLCDRCINSCTTGNQNANDLALLTSLRDYNGHALIYVNLETYTFFAELEKIFSHHIERLKTSQEDVSQILLNLMVGVEVQHFASCHDMQMKIVRRYILFRLRSSMTKPVRQKRYDSKSMSIVN